MSTGNSPSQPTGSPTPQGQPLPESSGTWGRADSLPAAMRPSIGEEPPYLTLKTVLEHPDLVRQACVDKGHTVDIDKLVELENQRRQLQSECEEGRGALNQISKKWKQLSAEEQEASKGKRQELAAKEQLLEITRTAVSEIFDRIPNFLDPEVPRGTPAANQIVREVGAVPTLDFEPRSQKDICERLGLVDFEGGVTVAGRGFYYLERELYIMRHALSSIFMGHLVDKGYIPCTTPIMANPQTLYGTGYLPWASKDNYRIGDTDLALIGTSEQTLLGRHFGQLMSVEDLPICYVGDTQCFRTEAGSAGVDTKGLMRVHQFGKVEQIIICHPEESKNWHEAALANEEWIVQSLGIPYRVMLLASQDVGAPGYKKYDIEGWFPSQNTYRELTSNTNFRDFQSRRLNLRCKVGVSKERVYPHTISATGFSDRLLGAVLENYQNADGSVTIPAVLTPYFGGKTKIDGVRKKPSWNE